MVLSAIAPLHALLVLIAFPFQLGTLIIAFISTVPVYFIRTCTCTSCLRWTLMTRNTRFRSGIAFESILALAFFWTFQCLSLTFPVVGHSTGGFTIRCLFTELENLIGPILTALSWNRRRVPTISKIDWNTLQANYLDISPLKHKDPWLWAHFCEIQPDTHNHLNFCCTLDTSPQPHHKLRRNLASHHTTSHLAECIAYFGCNIWIRESRRQSQNTPGTRRELRRINRLKTLQKASWSTTGQNESCCAFI